MTEKESLVKAIMDLDKTLDDIMPKWKEVEGQYIPGFLWLEYETAKESIVNLMTQRKMFQKVLFAKYHLIIPNNWES